MMEKTGRVVLVAAVALLCWNCASNTCTRKSARALGKRDAVAWDGDRPGMSRARSCKGDYGRGPFRDDYEAAFQKALRRQCTPDAAWEMGQAAVRDEDHGVARREVLQLCADVGVEVEPLQAQYVAAVQSVLCEERAVAESGARRGVNLRRPDLGWLALCPQERGERLRNIYERAHAAGVEEACAPAVASRFGLETARAGREPDAGLNAYARCPQELQAAAVAAYQDAYYAESQRQAAQREAAERRAERARREAARQQRDAMVARQFAQANQQRFFARDKELVVTCTVQDGNVVLEVFNPHRAYVSFSADFQVEVYNAQGRLVKTFTEHDYVNLGWESRSSDRAFGFLPNDAAACVVRRVTVR